MKHEELKTWVEENPDKKLESVLLDKMKFHENRFDCIFKITNEGKTLDLPIHIEYPKGIDVTKPLNRKLISMAMGIQLANMTMFSSEVNFKQGKQNLNDRDFDFFIDMLFQTASTFEMKFGGIKNRKPVPFNYPLLNPNEYDINKKDRYAVSMSGGKESSLSYTALKLHNYSAESLFFDDGRFQPSEMMYQALPWSPVIKSNIFDLFDFIAPKWGKNNLFLPIIAFMELVYCNEKGIRNLVFGNEYDCTVQLDYKGHPVYGHNFDQSTAFERKISQYLKDIGTDMQMFSILYNMSETAIQGLLVENDVFNLHKYQMSCFTPKKDGKIFNPCNICDKCQRIGFMLEGLNSSPGFIGLSSHLDICNSKNVNAIFNCEDGKEEFETLLYLLEKNNKIGHRGMSIFPKWNKKIFDLMIDDLHPLILPEDLREFFDIKLKKLRGKLNG